MNLKKLKPQLFLAVIPILAAVFSHYAMKVSVLTSAERAVSDIFVARHFGPSAPQDPDVVIVAVTENTLEQFPYREPVDRAFLAGVLKALEKAQARAIGFDFIFDQPTEQEKDDLLKKTIHDLKVPLVVSYTNDPGDVNEDQQQYLDDFVPRAARVSDVQEEDAVDGEVRTIYPGKKLADGSYLMGFARGLAAAAGVPTPQQHQEIAWHGKDATSKEAKYLPFYVIESQYLNVYPPELIEQYVKGKVILVGGMVTLRDHHRTPLDAGHDQTEDTKGLSGIEIHAHATSQLLQGRRALRVSGGGEWLLVLGLAALGSLFGKFNHSLVRHVLMAGLTAGLLFGAVFYCQLHYGLTVPFLEPTMGFVLAVWGTDAFTGREEKRQRAFINGAFTRYLNPSLVKQLAEDPARLQLGGEMREMTLFFCDIRGFTTISEKFDAQGLTRFINRFLTPMTDLIMESGGTIDKYMGDAIMAFWNAPLDDVDHAEHGCRAALRMRKRLVELNQAWEAEAIAAGQKHIPVNIGMGLNTGICCVGNMGSDQRFDYSVLGDDVNLASRLEGQSKTYHLDLVIGARTAGKIPMLATLELDSIMVKGKTEPVLVYTVVGDETVAAEPKFQAQKVEHDAMLAAFRRQDWDGATALIEKCRALTPPLMLGFYELYEERIADYRANPPPADWDGVYVAKTK